MILNRAAARSGVIRRALAVVLAGGSAMLSLIPGDASLARSSTALSLAWVRLWLPIVAIAMATAATVLAAAFTRMSRRYDPAGNFAAWSSAATATFGATAVILALAWMRQSWPVPPWLAILTPTLGTALLGKAAVSSFAGPPSAGAARQVHPSARDYLALTKPVIVLLLLVTTLSGLIVGAHGWPGTGVVLWTMLGGALAAGGASALNQYIDRDLDAKMQRTQARPLPDGRVSQVEALGFGLVLCMAGFYVLAIAVNLLSALMALAGMVYYVGLYSLILKKTTPQNIVVGGGAGAIPPLVGWAAATGSLNMQAFFLFAIIFFWTPPHFWALALLRRNDYARAGVPMLPVVRGERETRWEILLYTVQLVVLTLLMPLVGDGGAFFIVSAAALGAGLILLAWRLWRTGGNRKAWGLYRYSSMYLAFIFAALVVDTLLRH